jgi:predicted membrane-bound dolichyl-phosphate-mannose-protein mannosyltransferase
MLRRPVILLAVVSLLSLGARAALLGDPCRDRCRTATDHTLVFDEIYYVNAARRIAGVEVPRGDPYATAPAGVDPNAEHPQLAKLIIAASIEALGDGPWAWRLGSLVLGSLAILGMFALVRAAGGSQWLALGAATLMAADNLLLVHGRIGTLDIYAVTAMIWAAALYLRGRPVSAGALVGVGACFKLVAPFALLVLVIYEGLLVARSRGLLRDAIVRLSTCAVAAVGVFLALLAVLDRVAAPYDYSRGARITGGVFGHVGHMLSFGAHQVSRHGPTGIASYPWQWLGDYKPITYLNIEPRHPTRGLAGIHPAVHFLGVVSPPILLLAAPGLALAAWGVRRGVAAEVDLLGIAWFVGAFLPFELLSVIFGRTSYLYYMVIVLPGVYVLVARLIERRVLPRWLAGAWAAAVLVAVIVMYPLTPLP